MSAPYDPIAFVRIYAAHGIPTFPVYWPRAEGCCSCRLGTSCENIGKHPMTRNGLDDATTDIDQLILVWEKFPEANIGLATGQVMEVLDLDTDDATRLVQDELAKHGATSTLGGFILDDDPPIVRTGKGHHVWYSPIGGTNRAGMVHGVDWRGKGGYVLAPPSLHANGRRYSFGGGPLEFPLPKPPHGLTDLVLRQGPWARSETVRYKSTPKRSIVDRLDQGRWNPGGLIRDMEAQPEGNRNAFLFYAAITLLEDQDEFDIEQDEIDEALKRLAVAAVDSGLGDREVVKTIQSAESRYANGVQDA